MEQLIELQANFLATYYFCIICLCVFSCIVMIELLWCIDVEGPNRPTKVILIIECVIYPVFAVLTCYQRLSRDDHHSFTFAHQIVCDIKDLGRFGLC